MAERDLQHFRLSWVLQGELAVGPAPRQFRHLDRLAAEGIKAVLSLSAAEEAPLPEGLSQRFLHERVVLPDHRVQRPMQAVELKHALEALARLHAAGPVFVHCVAAVERSPLLCMAWLMRQRRLSRMQALDYLMSVHPGTCPLPDQLALLEG